MRWTALLIGAACLAPQAQASTRAFTETYETRTGSQGDAQIETWVDDDNAFANWDVWRFWWGGTASLTDRLEVSLYVLGAQQSGGKSSSADADSGGLQLEALSLQGRYRFIGDGLSGFSAMGQLEVGIPFLGSVADQSDYNYLSHATTLGERLIASYDWPHVVTSANLLVEETFTLSTQTNAASYAVDAFVEYAVGAAFAPWPSGLHGPPFTIGLEAFGELPFNHAGVWAVSMPGGFPFAIGPAISFASGRFWATASYGYAPSGAFADPAYSSAGLWSSSEGVGRLIAAFEF